VSASTDVCASADVAPGRLTPVKLGRATVVLTRLSDGRLRAISGRCPHHGAPLEHGCVSAAVVGDGVGRIRVARAHAVLRCPWHGFEFDLEDGAPLVPAPEGRRMTLRFHDVAEEGGRVFLRA
jgi:nitrite reductase/ring-hydroxylating ferredoxin subunit